MKQTIVLLLFIFALISSCTPSQPGGKISVIVQYSAASAPWLANVYDCAGGNIVKAEQVTAEYTDIQSRDLILRIGEPGNLSIPAFQIGSEEILVIVHKQNPINSLSTSQVQKIFSGQILNWQEINSTNGSIRVWTFPAGEDIEQVFEKKILGGIPVTSNARLATSMEEMSQAISEDIHAVGILPGHWKTGNTSEIYTVSNIPVLALTKEETPEELNNLLNCVQNKMD